MLDPKEAEVNTIGGNREAEVLTVSDINSCSEVDDFGSFKIEYPYEITISDSKKKIIVKEKTQKAFKAKDWTKKFYTKEGGNGNMYVAYSRYQTLLALSTIKAKMVDSPLPPKINLNDFVGFEFQGVVVRPEDGDPFIDWVGTFEVNGIEVPTVDEIESGKSTTKKEEPVTVKVKAENAGTW